ncbi:hypothetical protein P0082_02815 [Candidatus Haliotispira prima]|uniref:Glycosyltransferase n=1 Tax=Candidatus Haliotispira prima TaxID=3034016 RepID=A0ABY8MIR3_9SPIO|nr:hypothetical protein P0082_02815 [Candidatus Haliotispira prima]
MENDDFVSIGIVLSNDFNLELIELLHDAMSKEYHFFEIMLLKQNTIISDCLDLLNKVNNVRVLEVFSSVDIEVAYTVLLENSIGDYLVLMDMKYNRIDDLLNILSERKSYDMIIGERKRETFSNFEIATFKIIKIIILMITNIKIDNFLSNSNFFVVNRKVINWIIKSQSNMSILFLKKSNDSFRIHRYTYSSFGKINKRRAFWQNINFAINIIGNYSNRLIRIGTMLSLIVAIANLFYMFYALALFIFKADIVSGWTSINLYNSAMNFVLFLVVGIFGEYIRISFQSRKNNNLCYEVLDEKGSVVLLSNKKNIDIGKK